MKWGPPRARPEEPEHPFVASLEYQGITIDVEHRKGGVRKGIDPNGKAWAVRMPAIYGEVRGTKGADGDAVDVYVGPHPYAPYVYVIQTKYPRKRSFDEVKVFLGYLRRQDAVADFRRAYNAPGFMLGCTRWPFAAWAEAMRRPHLARGRLTRPLTKAVVRYRDRMRGGLADRSRRSDFDPQALEKGIRVELEHTDNRQRAEEIARDHLTEDPKYYDKLERMEKGRADLPEGATPVSMLAKASRYTGGARR